MNLFAVWLSLSWLSMSLMQYAISSIKIGIIIVHMWCVVLDISQRVIITLMASSPLTARVHTQWLTHF